jgi:hypothetical protein
MFNVTTMSFMISSKSVIAFNGWISNAMIEKSRAKQLDRYELFSTKSSQAIAGGSWLLLCLYFSDHAICQFLRSFSIPMPELAL